MDTSLTVKELIALGNAIIQVEELSDESIWRAYEFSEGVSALLATLGTTSPIKKELEELTAIHQQVLARLKSHREVVGKSLKGMRHKGKGIKAYLDQKKGRAETQKKGKNS